MNTASFVTRDLVLVGGGHSHVEVLKRFAMRPEPGVRLTLVSRDSMTPYSGMVPGYLAGHYTLDQSHIDLGPLCRFAGARLFNAAATGFDLPKQRVLMKDRPPVRFDVLSVDIGSRPNIDMIPGAQEFAIPVKPIDRFLEQWHAIEKRIAASERSMRIAIIGAGAGGVELALSLHHRVHQAMGGRVPPTFSILTDKESILYNHAPSVRRRLLQALKRRNIEVLTEHNVVRMSPNIMHCTNGTDVPFDAAIAVTFAAPARWITDTGLATNDDGFIRITQDLQSISHAQVFAAGDIAAIDDRPLPKAGVYAVRQGPALARNLRLYLRSDALRPFRPQRRILALISTGAKRAVASYGALSIEGDWVWRWKDWIDQRWMLKYQDLRMKQEPGEGVTNELAPSPSMRCGGCGAKVSSTVLHNVLRRLPTDTVPAEQDTVLLGIGDDAAVITVPEGQSLVQSVDQFRTFTEDPYLFGLITANHCLSDLYAMGATPHSALAAITLPFAKEEIVENDLSAVMRGIMKTLDEAGAQLIGGHTSEGETLSVGLTVNGLVSSNKILRKGGARPGDLLILTKPLGTGLVLAAEMRGQISSAHVAQALEMMSQSNQAAAQIIARRQASACTDITGFGLLGHLIEMLKASQSAAEINVENIPLLDGVIEVLATPLRSSLHPANKAFEAAIAGPSAHPATDILFDPQTAGGLLAGVSPDSAHDCLRELRDSGYENATIIGHITNGPVGAISLHQNQD